jgi:tripartite-type tricarboxylate transporter receptor subunit TctC
MAALLLMFVTTLALAVEWPHRTVKIIVGGAPGSAPDLVARLIADRLGPNLGRPVVVENRQGASGQLAMGALVHSPPDGHTLALATMSQAVFNSHMFAKLSYDPLRDLEPIGTLVTGATAIAVHPSFPAQTFADLVAHAKTRPKELFVALPGNGSPPHLVLLMLQKAAEFELAGVPHGGGPDAVNAVLAGRIPILMAGPTSIAPHVASGKLRALLVTGEIREPTLPGVPTAAEAGLQIRGEAWIGLVAPAGTPSLVVARINRETAQILASPEVDERLKKLGFRALPSSPEAFTRQIREEHSHWGTAIRELGLKLDP